MSLASDAKFDIREDEEQYKKLQDCIDLLVASGYFRARIKGLSAFDKIVGGMVWCISVCNYTVDIDLLYAENSTIGQKIALTERIVEVLPILKCPFAIEPHQIQGLDFIHIFPVIQWLVKKTIEARKEHGDELEAHANYHCEKANTSKNPLTDRIANLSSSITPDRVFRRGPAANPESIHQDVMCTLAEYSGSVEGVGGSSSQPAPRLEEASVRDRISTKSLRKIVDAVQPSNETIKPQLSTPEQTLSELEKQIEETVLEGERLSKELEKEEEEKSRIDQLIIERASEKVKNQKLIEKFSSEELEEFRGLLLEYDQVAKQEKQFKAACRSELKAIEAEIDTLRSIDNNSMGESALEVELGETLEKMEAQLAAERILSAESAKKLAVAQRELDSFPSQIEMSQYQQRFIELYNQMASKHRETKQYFTLHNTLVDVRDYMKKEISLLGKIEDVLPMATKDAYRDSFIQNLQEILKSVEASHDKLSMKATELDGEKTELTVEYSQLRENQRAFYRATEKFEQVCKRNDELRKEMN